MSMITDHPLSLRVLVDTARSKIGFFPAHTPRTLEYPWMFDNLPRNLEGQAILDVGAGVNPLPLALADRGAAVFTIDNDPQVRDISRRVDWNEWGFLDYSQLDNRIVSVQASYETWAAGKRFDCIYSVSVVEHLPASVRRRWIAKFVLELNSLGLLLLSVDLIPQTNQLWNLAAGKVVEPEEVHGTIEHLLQELTHAGFTVEEQYTKRNIPESRVDVGFVRARRALRTSTVSSDLRRERSHPTYNLDRFNAVCQPLPSTKLCATAGEALAVAGWAVDGNARSLASAVEIVIDGVPYEARYGLRRNDVAEYFHHAEYSHSGFDLSLPGILFGAGQHVLSIRVVSAARDRYWESASFRFVCEAPVRAD